MSNGWRLTVSSDILRSIFYTPLEPAGSLAERNWLEACSDFGHVRRESGDINSVQILEDVPPIGLNFVAPCSAIPLITLKFTPKRERRKTCSI